MNTISLLQLQIAKWMICDFISFSAVFQSHQDNKKAIMKGCAMRPGPKVIKLFSCSTQLSMKFQMLISIKISRNSVFLGSVKGQESHNYC